MTRSPTWDKGEDDEDEDAEALGDVDDRGAGEVHIHDEALEVIAVDEAAEIWKLRRESCAAGRRPEGAGYDEFVSTSCFG